MDSTIINLIVLVVAAAYGLFGLLGAYNKKEEDEDHFGWKIILYAHLNIFSILAKPTKNIKAKRAVWKLSIKVFAFITIGVIAGSFIGPMLEKKAEVGSNISDFKLEETFNNVEDELKYKDNGYYDKFTVSFDDSKLNIFNFEICEKVKGKDYYRANYAENKLEIEKQKGMNYGTEQISEEKMLEIYTFALDKLKGKNVDSYEIIIENIRTINKYRLGENSFVLSKDLKNERILTEDDFVDGDSNSISLDIKFWDKDSAESSKAEYYRYIIEK